MTRKHYPKSTGLSRRRVLKTAVAAGAVLGFPAIVRPASAKKFLKPIVAGLNAKEGDPSYNSIALIPKFLREKFDIEMEFQIHHSSTLGTDISQLEAVQTGFIDITSNATPQFSRFSKDFEFVGLPYAITDWDMGERLFKSELWQRQAASFEQAVPVKVLAPVGAGGFRMLWNSRRVLKGPADVDGLKFRTTGSPLSIQLIKNWGGNPTPIPWTETYNALKTGVVDGFHVQPIWTYLFKMHEVLAHATEVRALFSVQLQVMNANTFNALPEAMRGPFLAAAQMAADVGNSEDRAKEDGFKQKLREAGKEIYTPSAAELAEWRKGGEAVWESHGGDIDRAVLDDMIALRG